MKHSLREHEAAAYAAMKNEAKRAYAFPLFSTFFMAEGCFILHAPSGALYLKARSKLHETKPLRWTAASMKHSLREYEAAAAPP